MQLAKQSIGAPSSTGALFKIETQRFEIMSVRRAADWFSRFACLIRPPLFTVLPGRLTLTCSAEGKDGRVPPVVLELGDAHSRRGIEDEETPICMPDPHAHADRYHA